MSAWALNEAQRLRGYRHRTRVGAARFLNNFLTPTARFLTTFSLPTHPIVRRLTFVNSMIKKHSLRAMLGALRDRLCSWQG
jgi:hypothetical protein